MRALEPPPPPARAVGTPPQPAERARGQHRRGSVERGTRSSPCVGHPSAAAVSRVRAHLFAETGGQRLELLLGGFERSHQSRPVVRLLNSKAASVRGASRLL